MNEWTQIKASGRRELLDTMCAVMSMIDAQIQIEDYGDLDEMILDGVYGDLIDEAVLAADREHASVSVYIPRERSLGEAMAFLRERFGALGELGADVNVEAVGVSEEDWAETWKQYYHPVKVGRAVIVPAWEEYDPQPGEIIVTMDPGMAFGTGTHETTRLVIGLIEKYMKKGGRVLDLGCGSGILSICASKLGAGKCFAYDIDPVAVRVADENVRANGADNIVCGVSDLLGSVDTDEKYDLIVANIVADIILRMAADVGDYLKPDGVLIVSGIIDERSADVTDAFTELGYKVIEESHENGWCAAALTVI